MQRMSMDLPRIHRRKYRYSPRTRRKTRIIVDTTSLANRSRRPRKTRTIHRRTPSKHRASHKREMRRKPHRGANTVSRAQTSIAAYQQKKREGSLTGDRHKVFQLIQSEQPIPGNQIARKMQKPYHTISGRITELLKQNYIEVAGTTENQFGNKVRTYQVKK